MSNLAIFNHAAALLSGADFKEISEPIVQLINSILAPALAIVGAIGVLYCIVLGVNYAKASEPQEHEKAKNHLKNAIIGFVLIFVLMLALKIGTSIMTKWYEDNAKSSNSSTTTVETTEKK